MDNRVRLCNVMGSPGVLANGVTGPCIEDLCKGFQQCARKKWLRKECVFEAQVPSNGFAGRSGDEQHTHGRPYFLEHNRQVYAVNPGHFQIRYENVDCSVIVRGSQKRLQSAVAFEHSKSIFGQTISAKLA